MTTFPKNRAINVVIGLTLFWLIIFSAFYGEIYVNLRFIPFWISAVLLGAFFSATASQEKIEKSINCLKYNRRLNLGTSDKAAFISEENGVISTIGGVPFIRRNIPSKESIELTELFLHLPNELPKDEFIILFKEYLTDSAAFPASYRALIDAVLKVFLHADHVRLPAGIDKHNNRSLITHSILVSALMLHGAKEYKYKPKYTDPIDQTYTIDLNDPILMLVGISHDIGKIKCLQINGDGVAIGMNENHAQESCRIISELPEFWNPAISHIDRRIIQQLLAYYHCADKLPVQRSETSRPKVTSDRLYAIMGLLIQCDVMAGSIEYGTKYSFLQSAQQIIPNIEAEDIESLDIGALFLEFITGSKVVINGPKGMASDIFRYKGMIDTVELDVLLINEESFLQKFSAFTGHANLGVKSGKKSELTSLTLDMLDAQNLLVRAPNELGHRNARDCLYKITFHTPGKIDEAPILTLRSAFVINLANYSEAKFLSDRESCHFIPSFKNSIYGNQGNVNQDFKSHADRADKKLLNSTDKFEIIDAFTIQPKKLKEKFSPEGFVMAVKRGLAVGQLIPITLKDNPNNDIIIIGQNAFFKNIGMNPEKAMQMKAELENIRVKEFKWSKSKPDSFAVVLERSFYTE